MSSSLLFYKTADHPAGMFIHEHLDCQPQGIGQAYPALKASLCIQYLVIEHRMQGKLFVKERINQAECLKHLSRCV